MKTTFLGVRPLALLCVILAPLLLIQCSNEHDTIVVDSPIKQRTVNSFDYVGVEHNNILDTVFSWIEFAYLNEELDGKTSDEDLLEFVEDLVIQYKDEKYATGSQTDSALTVILP